MTDDSTLEEYLGLIVKHNKDGSYEISQPMLVKRIIQTVPSLENVRESKTLASPGETLHTNEGGEKEGTLELQVGHRHVKLPRDPQPTRISVLGQLIRPFLLQLNTHARTTG